MYKLGTTDNLTQTPTCIWRLSDGAELQDADGNVVADAQAYVAGLP